MRTFTIGDIHGKFKLLKQVLERANFDYENDMLITLGDICDGGMDTYLCVEELLKIKNRIDIIGNHDKWFLTFIDTTIHPDGWRQGGFNTARSYADKARLEKLVELNGGDYNVILRPEDVPEAHQDFFKGQHLYYKDEKNRVFVHGGFYRFYTLEVTKRNNPEAFYWDRELFEEALSVHKGEKLKFKEDISEVFLGHTSTLYWKETEPIHADIVWNLDTGAGGRDGKLTIMDVDTHEYWQSDVSKELYPVGDFR